MQRVNAGVWEHSGYAQEACLFTMVTFSLHKAESDLKQFGPVVLSILKIVFEGSLL